MKSIADIQQYIFDNTGLKTGVRKGKGSMRGYSIIYPIFQNGNYPNLPTQVYRELKNILPDGEPYPTFCTNSDISIHESKGFDIERNIYEKENKPKPLQEMKVKTWGSKNSQLRLDKRTASNAKRMKNGNTARYY